MKTVAKPLAHDQHLSQALAASAALARLQHLAKSVRCAPTDLSSDGGRSIDMLRLLDVMRARGYHIDPPVMATAQPNPQHTVWLIDVVVPTGVGVRLGVPLPRVPA